LTAILSFKSTEDFSLRYLTYGAFKLSEKIK
jgi:hypothetical protein